MPTIYSLLVSSLFDVSMLPVQCSLESLFMVRIGYLLLLVMFFVIILIHSKLLLNNIGLLRFIVELNSQKINSIVPM